MAKIPILCPQRVRRVPRSYSWLDHRLLREGHFDRLSRDEIALYTFLVLVGNCHGLSYYRSEKICRHLAEMDWGSFLAARKRLEECDLITFQPYYLGCIDGIYQVLSIESACGGRQQ